MIICNHLSILKCNYCFQLKLLFLVIYFGAGVMFLVHVYLQWRVFGIFLCTWFPVFILLR